MNVMHDKGYEAIVSVDDDASLFHGEVRDIRDVVTFQGTSVAGLKEIFAQSVDDCPAFCAARGEEPNPAAFGV